MSFDYSYNRKALVYDTTAVLLQLLLYCWCTWNVFNRQLQRSVLVLLVMLLCYLVYCCVGCWLAAVLPCFIFVVPSCFTLIFVLAVGLFRVFFPPPCIVTMMRFCFPLSYDLFPFRFRLRFLSCSFLLSSLQVAWCVGLHMFCPCTHCGASECQITFCCIPNISVSCCLWRQSSSLYRRHRHGQCCAGCRCVESVFRGTDTRVYS